MKTDIKKFGCLVTAACTLVCMSAQAATLTWDPSGTGGSDGSGTWNGANEWDNGGPATWNNGTPDDAVIGSGGTGGIISLGGAVTAGTILFDNFSGTYDVRNDTLDSSGGITVGATAGNVLFNRTLLTGSGDVTMNGSGELRLGSNPEPSHTFTGDLIINNGRVQMRSDTDTLPNGNHINISEGALTFYWGQTFTRGFGTGANEIEITGGVSGFGQNGSGGTLRFFNNNGTEVDWGTATFNPSTLLLQDGTGNNNTTLVWENPLDLNGGARIIQTSISSPGSGRAEMNRTISDSVGGASLTKTGNGLLWFDGSNTYAGDTTVSEGELEINGSHTTGNDYTVASGATLDVDGTVAVSGTTTIAGTADVNGTLRGDATVQSGGTLSLNTGVLGDAGGADVITVENGGTLTSTGNSDLRGAITVQSGGLMNLSDTLSDVSAGSVTVDDGGTFRVEGGNVVNSMTVDGIFTIADVGGIGHLTADTYNHGVTGTFVYSIDSDNYQNPDTGDYTDGAYNTWTQSDWVTVTSALTLSDPSTIEVNILGGTGVTTAQEFVLFEIENGGLTWGGDVNDFVFVAGGSTAFGPVPPTVTLLANAGPGGEDLIVFSLTAVNIPEPSTMALYGLGGLLIYLRRRNLFRKMA